ncbi:hypothetical protein [Streptomyces chartreusis]|jgi:hypothetical protein|uniref:hypothetical protein n=1 Tax=Streptomyces chartreusis TaxID=1969 RepID=UPI003814C19F
MKPTRRTAATAAALATLALGGTLATTAPASAATTAGAYNGKCGTGYNVQDRTEIHDSARKVIGTVYVTYSRETGQHCAVLVRSNPGTRTFMEVTLDTDPTFGKPERDYGSYSTYAGPVYLDASKSGAQCLEWSGTIDIYYDSVRGLCS